LALGLAIFVAGCSTGGGAARDEESHRPTTREIHKVDLKDLAVWRYDAAEDRWTVVRGEVMRAILFEPIGRVESPTTTRPLRADPMGLYWVGWMQDGVRRGSFIFRGPVQCDDAALARLGPPPPGTVAACVPTESAGTPQFVPDPRVHCK
jgi:hypothetical protein